MIEHFFDLVLGNFQTVGMIVMTLAFWFDRERLEMKWDALAKFVGFMVLFTCFRLAVFDTAIDEGVRIPEIHEKIKLGNFLTVFLEDAFFVMIPYYINKRIDSKIIRGSIWLFFSGMFGMGHIYQGIWAVFITGCYPYFISYRYSMKTSFTTVMACHFLWDCFIVLTHKFHQILQSI